MTRRLRDPATGEYYLLPGDREAELRAEVERLSEQVRNRDYALDRVQDIVERLRALLQKLEWKSIDKDNMEYSCRIPYNVMDEIRAALEPKP